jgi:hypothetical protein
MANEQRQVPSIVTERSVVRLEREGSIATSNLPSAVDAILGGLREAVAGMNPDDIDVSLQASQDGDKSTATFRLRAYRRAADK